MYCPKCRAEYREGFTRCSDCGLDLVEVLPPPSSESSGVAEYERPDRAPTRYFLAWLLPMCVYGGLFCAIGLKPVLLQNVFIVILLFFLHLSLVSGQFWMLYQSVRYERRVGRYALLSFVPFMFVWYSLVRVPLRKEFQGESPFVR